MSVIINLTQHKATPEQVNAGVINLEGDSLKKLKELLSFESLPEKKWIAARAMGIASLGLQEVFEKGLDTAAVMIGGAPFLMPFLEAKCKELDLKPVYAFSERVSEESLGPEGQVVKKSVFKHVGFVEV